MIGKASWTFSLSVVVLLVANIIVQFPLWSSIYYRVNQAAIEQGHLTIIDRSRNESQIYSYGNPGQEPSATITILDERYFRHVVKDIDVGLGESYVAGYWETDDIAKYLRLLFLNYKNENAQYWFYYLQCFSLSQWVEIYNYWSTPHDASQDQEIIHHHYDWGTSLFQSFLDSTMTYTAANFEEGSDDLERAQINKVRRLVDKANINKNDRVLEIGFGFGYLASFVLNNTDAASVTGITLSHDQLEYAQNRYVTHSTTTNITETLKYLYRDYRHYINGKEKFDAIISVEMIEAIGYENIDTYFKTVSNSLREGGRFVIQYGAYSTWAFPKHYRKSGSFFPTFVVKHIFPAHFEPDEQDIHASALKHGLELVHSEKFGLHYAKTLRIWLENLIAAQERVVDIYGEEVFRTFKYYLACPLQNLMSRQSNLVLIRSQAVYQTQILHEIQAVYRKSDSLDIGVHLDEQIVTL